MLFDKAVRDGVAIGTATGIASVFWERKKWLTTDAYDVLDKEILRGGTFAQQGARKALIEHGLIEDRWWGLSRRITEKGHRAISSARARRLPTTTGANQ